MRTRLNPALAPLPEGGADVTLLDKIRALPGLIPPLLIVFVVLGSIYGGVTGITEAAAMGTIAVLILITLRRELSWPLFRDAVMRTFTSTGTIIWVTFGATALAGAYSIVGGPVYVANLIVGADLPALGVLVVMMAILLFLGCIMDWVGIVLLVMPVFLPIVQRLPIEEIGLWPVLDPAFVSVWFGILFCVNMQVSFLSPPFGPAAFYLLSEVGGAARDPAPGHLPRLPAVHRHPADRSRDHPAVPGHHHVLPLTPFRRPWKLDRRKGRHVSRRPVRAARSAAAPESREATL